MLIWSLVSDVMSKKAQTIVLSSSEEEIVVKGSKGEGDETDDLKPSQSLECIRNSKILGSGFHCHLG